MSCIVFHGHSDENNPVISEETFPIPSSLLQGEVLLKLDGATLCNSDIHTLQGRRQEPTPGVLGHEGCGHVVVSARSGISVGDRVTFSVTDTCGNCDKCEYGPQQKCVSLKKYGHIQHGEGTVPRGCYSTHILLGPGTAVITLPPELDLGLATPINCALATMVAVRRMVRHALGPARARPNKSVIIYGAGLLGLYGSALFREDEFTVYVADLNKKRVETAELFGAVKTMPENLKADAIIEVCGHGSVVKQGLAHLRPGGVAALVGCVTPNTDLDLSGDTLVRGMVTLIGVHNYQHDDLATAVQFLTKSPYRDMFKKVVSPPLSLSQFNEALDLAITGSYHRVLLKL